MKTKLTNKEITRKYKEFLYPSVITYYDEPLALVSGKGNYVYDAEGTEYLDFFGGILTVSLGHCNETITNKTIEQLKKLQHVSTLYPTSPAGELAEKLSKIMPGKLKKSFFTSSGTEADETAILTAQRYTGAQEIIALRHCYSGRSALAMSLTAHASWRISKTLVPGIHHAIAPYCYRCAFHLKYPSCDMACARDMEELIQTQTCGKIAAFIAEPILGVGGFITPPKEYFKVAVDIVRKYGGLFISDEVQTGWGRTGNKWFGIEQFGVDPDIMTSAKGMANGLPIGWTAATPEVADGMKGLTICTFGGNPVSTATALAVIEYIEQEKLVNNAAVVGDYLRQQLMSLYEKYPIIGEVRGMGLMQGIEVVTDRKSKTPNVAAVLKIFEETKKDHLLIGKGGLYGNVIRITPPLNITKGDVDTMTKKLDKAFSAVK
ncbi:MAG TPA: aspartate aminotransferase family protein [Candidatus Wallbacteria bacterium]|nr:aspartate aminotransferase family protein [Candidatus Wallbacteria bacterium]